MRAEFTHYSELIPGAKANHGWPVRFDKTNGTIGISQQDEHGKWSDRVLLSIRQVRELQAFMSRRAGTR